MGISMLTVYIVVLAQALWCEFSEESPSKETPPICATTRLQVIQPENVSEWMMHPGPETGGGSQEFLAATLG
jgi:hypothetical protein